MFRPLAEGRSGAAMSEISQKLGVRVLAALSLALAACGVSADGQILCADDSSCPAAYPVCVGATPTALGKCGAGSPPAATVAIVGAEGHGTSDFVANTVRVDVTAKAPTGVSDVKL